MKMYDFHQLKLFVRETYISGPYEYTISLRRKPFTKVYDLGNGYKGLKLIDEAELWLEEHDILNWEVYTRLCYRTYYDSKKRELTQVVANTTYLLGFDKPSDLIRFKLRWS